MSNYGYLDLSRRMLQFAAVPHTPSVEASKDKAALLKSAVAISALGAHIRHVAGHHWGWYSEESTIFHIQTVDGKAAIKFWLEERGNRCFSFCPEESTENLTGKQKKELMAAVRTGQEQLEKEWAFFAVGKGWVTASYAGKGNALVTFYKGHNSFTRTVNLVSHVPDLLTRGKVAVAIDKETACLTFGLVNWPPTRWLDIPLWWFMFEGKR
jgi:hypothetical protein